jgi:hypothetical protein
MDTGSAQQASDDADSFESFADGDFKVNRQRLRRCIAEHEQSPGPFSQGASAADPRAALLNLALDHLARHDIGPSPVAPRCAFVDDACKALGAARVVLALGWTPIDERAAAPALALHEAFAAADRALAALAAQIATYNDARQVRHQFAAQVPPKAVPCTTFGHAQYCGPPARLPALVDRWRKTLALVDATSLMPQIPHHLLTGERRGFLASLEAILDAHGWSPDEIAAVLDDDRGGKPRVRKDRLRHRLAELRARRADT